MTQPASYEDPDFRAHERGVRRRRLVAASVMVLALTGVAGGSAAAAVAVAQDSQSDPGMSSVVTDHA